MSSWSAWCTMRSTCLFQAHNSRSAVATGSRAARMAGKIPPKNPITTAQMIPWTSSAGVTMNANATWLKV